MNLWNNTYNMTKFLVFQFHWLKLLHTSSICVFASNVLRREEKYILHTSNHTHTQLMTKIDFLQFLTLFRKETEQCKKKNKNTKKIVLIKMKWESLFSDLVDNFRRCESICYLSVWNGKISMSISSMCVFGCVDRKSCIQIQQCFL